MNERDTDLYQFNLLLEASITIASQAIKRENVPGHDNLLYAQGLAKKIINHLLSIKELYQGREIIVNDNVVIQRIDFASISILTRAVFETYLTLHYLFISPINLDEKNFRILIWCLSGLTDREDTLPQTQDHVKQLQDEAVIVRDYKTMIQTLQTFHNLSERQKNGVLNKGEWRAYKKWKELALSAGFTDSFFEKYYRYVCGFAHSSQLSVIQINQIEDIVTQGKMANTSLLCSMGVTAKFIVDFGQIFPEIRQLDDTLKSYNLILHWKTIAENVTL